MQFDFDATMKEAPDAELIRIVITNRHEYQEAAVSAARRELERRNLEPEALARIRRRHERDNHRKAYLAAVPLELHWKLLAFLLPGAFQFFIAGSFKMNGYDRKAAEVGRWTLYGLFFYVGIFLLYASL
ncbi:hypothetical protein EPD60_07690 [Flaviaesturariibacter flavus]|uniref:Uncharacterized protein n=1 Tax=Flaviaesturariibacter flavus TaxID=2502780 RepID=A0A4R1BFD0_9BACT|nr:hypothetical protein [Flaviaesturariibacter flavus]TCJ15833.1 hypothetical protein EPD60_07690 [Flaviaesturariibacter flavus]